MANTEPIRTRQPKSRTKATILAKAYEMYLSHELEPGAERLAAVLERLGYTTGAGYQIWANQAEFRKDLQVYIANKVDHAGLCAIADRAAALAARKLPFEQHVLAAGDLCIDHLIGHEDFYVALRFFGLGRSRPAAVTDAMIDGYARLTRDYSEMLVPALQHFGRRMRPGLDIEHLTVAATALMEGYALRARVLPGENCRRITIGGEPHHPFSVAFLRLVEGMTETVPTGGSSE